MTSHSLDQLTVADLERTLRATERLVGPDSPSVRAIRRTLAAKRRLAEPEADGADISWLTGPVEGRP